MPTAIVPVELLVYTHPCPQEEKIRQIMESVRDGCIEYLPPIECKKIGNRYYIKDGTHRALALQRLGYKEILINYEE